MVRHHSHEEKEALIVPWWTYLHMWTESLSFPIFLILITPAVVMAIESLLYAVMPIMCFCITKLTDKIDRKKPWATKAYIASFVLQFIIMIIAIRICI